MGNILTINNTTFPTQEPWIHNCRYESSFELYPKWKGRRHEVYQGRAFDGRSYTSCTEVVIKAMRNCHACSTHWESYIKCSQEAKILASEFNNRCKNICVKITFIKPAVARMDDISDLMKIVKVVKRSKNVFQEDEAVLLEEQLPGDFTHFVSATGLTFGVDCEELHAFSHYTYHMTHGQIVVSDLKGVVHGGVFSLTNPTIHSRDRSFGPKDDGETGISQVCINHQCNKICQSLGLAPICFG